jgi:formylglycine-generating enzyme required for sulfatase activity
MSGKIFINYRRGDEPGFTQALLGRLEQSFPAERLFIDVDNIPPGEDFIHVLESQVAQCDTLLAVIGKGWLLATDEGGSRRLDDPDDFVRIEIESALKQGKRVIPVLVNEARMPRPDELPETLRPLARRNAVRLTHERFRADLQGLVKALQPEFEEVAALHPDTIGAVTQKPEPRKLLQPPRHALLLLGSVLGAVLAGSVGVWLATPHLTPVPQATTPLQPKPAPLQAPVTPTSPTPAQPTPAPVQAPATPLQPASSGVMPLLLERGPALKPKDSFKECDKCPEMIVVPAGSFTMGSPDKEFDRNTDEAPQHIVTFKRQFADGKFSVTFDEWDACVADGGCNGYRPDDHGWGRGRQPVINVSWNDAKAYVVWLSKKTGKYYRLLSESEREYVTRAGTTTPFWWGSSISTSQANYNGNYTYGDGVKGEDREHTVPVDSFQPNPWGLYQVHGNVWEWVEDCDTGYYDGAPTNGSAVVNGDCSHRMVRGGSWYYYPRDLRSASRHSVPADSRADIRGFRVGTFIP